MLSFIKKFLNKKEKLKKKFFKHLEKLKKEKIIDQHSILWIKRVLNLKDKTLEEVMVPRIDVVTVSSEASLKEIIEIYKKHRYSKMPVIDNQTDDIIGILHIKELLLHLDKPNLKAKEIVSPQVRYMPSNKTVLGALKDMQKEHISISIVVDEYGNVVGIVTMEDLLEEIVGEIMDELDKEEFLYKKISEDYYIFAGKIDLDTVEDLLGIKLESKEMHTLGGFLIEKFKKMPKPGEKLQIDSYEFIIKEATPLRILRVEVRKIGP